MLGPATLLSAPLLTQRLCVILSLLCSLLSPTRHFLESASPRRKTGCTGQFRFRAHEQTAASRSISEALFALPVEAARQPSPEWPAPWLPAPWCNAPGS